MSNLKKRLQKIASGNYELVDIKPYSPAGVVFELAYFVDTTELASKSQKATNDVKDCILKALNSDTSLLTKFVAGDVYEEIKGQFKEALNANDSTYFKLNNVSDVNEIENLSNEQLAKCLTSEFIEDAFAEFTLDGMTIDQDNRTVSIVYA